MSKFDNTVVISIRQYRELDGLKVFKDNLLSQDLEMEAMLDRLNKHYAGFKEYIETDSPTYDRALAACLITHMTGQCRLAHPDNIVEHELPDCFLAQSDNWQNHLLAVAEQVDNPDSPLKKGNFKKYSNEDVLKFSLPRLHEIESHVVQNPTSQTSLKSNTQEAGA